MVVKVENVSWGRGYLATTKCSTRLTLSTMSDGLSPQMRLQSIQTEDDMDRKPDVAALREDPLAWRESLECYKL